MAADGSHRRNKISGQFSARLIEMLESPAYRALSLSGHRVLARIEIEHAQHGGKENGSLPVTFDQFQEYGIHRHSVAPGMREAVALGFLQITAKGRAGNAEHRSPNLFRLTYRPAKGLPGDGTHDWRAIATLEDAEAIAASARSLKSSPKTKSQCRKMPVFGDENRHRKTNFPVPVSITKDVAKTGTTSISRGGKQPTKAREARSSESAVASGPGAPTERPEIIQNRIAQRLGADGWLVLSEIAPPDLANLTALEAAGNLDNETLASIVTNSIKDRPGRTTQ